VEPLWKPGGNLVENNKALFREKLCCGRSGKDTCEENALGKSENNIMNKLHIVSSVVSL
jgi:hypothetical protein